MAATTAEGLAAAGSRTINSTWSPARVTAGKKEMTARKKLPVRAKATPRKSAFCFLLKVFSSA